MTAVKRFRRAVQNGESSLVLHCKFNDAIDRHHKYNLEYSHPLHYAAFNGYPEMIDVLISEFGCDINLINCKGYTAFYIAIYSRKVKVCEKLIELNAEAPSSIPQRIIASLVYGYVRVDSSMQDSVDAVILEFLIYHQIIEASSIYTDLRHSSLSEKMMYLVIAAGYDINKRYTQDRMTLLMHHAKYYTNINMIKLMLLAGASVSIVDSDGRTVYNYLDEAYNVLERFMPKTPKDEILKLLNEGVTEEDQLKFDQEIENVRYRIDKRRQSLFGLLYKRLKL